MKYHGWIVSSWLKIQTNIVTLPQRNYRYLQVNGFLTVPKGNMGSS